MPVITTPTVPISLLDAVNMLLEAVKLASVMSLVPADLDESAGEALRTMGWASREVQLKGWNFNTLDNFTLTPDISKNINLPANFTLVLPDRRTPTSIRFTKRGNRLFDLTKNTFEWERSFPVRVVQTLEFQELPEPFRWYVTAKAGRRFCIPRSPESPTFRFTEEMVRDAEREAEDFDALEGGANLKATSPHHAFMTRKR